jgi:dTMP kinase
LGSHAVLALDQVACRGLKPDLTLLIDIDLETSLARVRARNTTQELGQNRMDEQSLDFYRRVHEAYRALGAKEPDRIRIVDGNTSVEALEQEVWRIVSAYV